MYSYKFTVQQSTKLFEVSSICLDNFSYSRHQKTSNLRLEVQVRSSLVILDIFDSLSALELNAEVVTLTPGTLCMYFSSAQYVLR
jgi:hypothetical protein